MTEILMHRGGELVTRDQLDLIPLPEQTESYVPVSHYFKRRKMFPTQEIKEERPDGSVVVTFRVGSYEAIRNFLKSWIPNIVILEPEDFKKELLKDVKGWVKRQEKLL